MRSFEPFTRAAEALTYPEGRALQTSGIGVGMNGPGADAIVDAASVHLNPRKSFANS